jgi:TetR/AcrR family transcriptional regulator, cholesterol catabolism regulator
VPSAAEGGMPSGSRPATASVSLADCEPTIQTQQDRRARILHAAVVIATERGYDNVLMRTVAHRAAVGTGTVYAYFPSKDHLLVAVFGLWLHRMCDQLAEAKNTDEAVHDRLTNIIRRLTEAASLHPQFTETMATAYLSAEPSAAVEVEDVRGQLTEMLAAAIGNGTEVNSRDTEIAAVLADVWAANVFALARKRSTPAEVCRRMRRTIALVTRGHGMDGV